MLVAREITKRYRRPVLEGVSLTVGPGEVVALIGANGSGKTTLLRCLLDLAAIDGGSVRIDGLPARRPASRARVAWLPERFLPPAFLTGAEFLRHMRALYGGGGDEPALAAALALDAAVLAQPVAELSKGTAQKLGLYACLTSGRTLLLLDEPMSGLDPLARAAVREALRAFAADGGSVLYTTHLLGDLEGTCDRLLVLHAGRVRFSGDMQAFLAAFDARTPEEAWRACVAPPAAAA